MTGQARVENLSDGVGAGWGSWVTGLARFEKLGEGTGSVRVPVGNSNLSNGAGSVTPVGVRLGLGWG